MSTQLSALRTEFYEIASEPSTSNVYTSTYVDNLLNYVQDEICRSFPFTFLRTKTFLATIPTTSVTTAVVAGDVTIAVSDTTYYPSSGSIYIGGDVVSYTGKTSTSFTGCTNVLIAHSVGDTVEPLYTMPTDFQEVLTMQAGKNNRWTDYTFVDEIDYDNCFTTFKWTILEAESVIRMNANSAGDYAMFQYFKKATVMSAETDLATIPDPFALQVIPKVAAGIAKMVKDDNIDNLGQIVMQLGKDEVKKMKRYYGGKNNFRFVMPLDYSALKSKSKTYPYYGRQWLP